jgi:mono/diheme cytochrome c family protein
VSAQVGTRRRRHGRLAVASAITVALAFAAASCGNDADDTSSGVGSAQAPAATSVGGANSTLGEQLARSSGCAGCHGPNFEGGAGPSLVGLAGSEVALADGSTLVADTAYLTRAIANPSADLVADYTLKMPANTLTDAEIADIVAYIETLTDG